MMSGYFRSSDRWPRRAIFSPTTEPIEPPMNAKSITPRLTGSESSVPVHGEQRVGVAGVRDGLLEARRIIRESRAGRWSEGRPRPPPSSRRRAAGCSSRPPGCAGDSRNSGRRSCSARTSRGCRCGRTPRTSPRRRRESPAARDAACAAASSPSWNQAMRGNLAGRVR